MAKQTCLVELMEDWPRPVNWTVRVAVWLLVFPFLAAFEAVKGAGTIMYYAGRWICDSHIYEDWLKMWWKLRGQL